VFAIRSAQRGPASSRRLLAVEHRRLRLAANLDVSRAGSRGRRRRVESFSPSVFWKISGSPSLEARALGLLWTCSCDRPGPSRSRPFGCSSVAETRRSFAVSGPQQERPSRRRILDHAVPLDDDLRAGRHGVVRFESHSRAFVSNVTFDTRRRPNRARRRRICPWTAQGNPRISDSDAALSISLSADTAGAWKGL